MECNDPEPNRSRSKTIDELIRIHERGMHSGNKFDWTDDKDMDDEFNIPEQKTSPHQQ
jgi:hypothetical protein